MKKPKTLGQALSLIRPYFLDDDAETQNECEQIILTALHRCFIREDLALDRQVADFRPVLEAKDFEFQPVNRDKLPKHLSYLEGRYITWYQFNKWVESRHPGNPIYYDEEILSIFGGVRLTQDPFEPDNYLVALDMGRSTYVKVCSSLTLVSPQTALAFLLCNYHIRNRISPYIRQKFFNIDPKTFRPRIKIKDLVKIRTSLISLAS